MSYSADKFFLFAIVTIVNDLINENNKTVKVQVYQVYQHYKSVK